MELGYTPKEVTLIMSEETCEKIASNYPEKSQNGTGKSSRFTNMKIARDISDAIDSMGKFVAIPGVAMMVAGDLNDRGLRALSNSVMSDRYADFYQSLIRDGEIVIDFTPHSAREKNMITGLWENYRGYPIIRRAENAA